MRPETSPIHSLSLSLDGKKPLPQEGEEWLEIIRAAKVIKNGRYDAEVIAFDKDGDVVALWNHIALVLGWNRRRSSRVGCVP